MHRFVKIVTTQTRGALGVQKFSHFVKLADASIDVSIGRWHQFVRDKFLTFHFLTALSCTENFIMSHRSHLPLVVLLTIACCGLAPRDAQAGPLLDWLFGRSRTAAAYPVGAPIPIGNGYGAGYGGYTSGYGAAGYGATYGAAPSGYAGNYGTYYSSQLPAIGPAGAGYTAPMPSGIASATLPMQLPPTLSYVPNFRTNAGRAPVTYYRPLLTTDPNTGAQVVAMAPCTSYEYMAQRVPEFGRTALFGSNTAPVFQPPTQALPTYTLPSGGVPLTYSTPAISAPYTTAYGAYGTNTGYGAYYNQQPSNAGVPIGPSALVAPNSVGPAGSYPTTPLAQSPYYGSTSGGSAGGYGGAAGSSSWQGVPGLVAPQAPASPANSYPVPSTNAPGPAPIYPGLNPAPTTEISPPSIPGNSVPGSSDPANFAPSLPSSGTSAQSNLRPQLRSFTSQPRSGEAPQVSNTSRDDRDANKPQLPEMLPIPVPQDFNHQPRWSPPLLREGDLTAMRPVEPQVAQLAGQSKQIHWASFESSPTAKSPATELQSSSNRLRPIRQSPAVMDHVPAASPALPPSSQPAPRVTTGWKASR